MRRLSLASLERSPENTCQTKMKSLREMGPQILLVSLTMLVAGAVGYLGSRLIDEALLPFQEHVLPSISKSTLFVSLMLSVCLSISALSYAWHVRGSFSTQRLKRKHPYDPETGLRYECSTGAWVCPFCIEKNDVIRMAITEASATRYFATCWNLDCGFKRITNEKHRGEQ